MMLSKKSCTLINLDTSTENITVIHSLVITPETSASSFPRLAAKERKVNHEFYLKPNKWQSRDLN